MSKEVAAEMFNPEPLDSIIKKVVAFHKWLSAVQNFINDPVNSPRPDMTPFEQYMHFYIDKDALGRLNKIAQDPECSALGVFYGLDSSKNNKITACFVGLKASGYVMDTHYDRDAGLLGEENWPPPPENFGVGRTLPCLSLSGPTTIQDFFKQHS